LQILFDWGWLMRIFLNFASYFICHHTSLLYLFFILFSENYISGAEFIFSYNMCVLFFLSYCFVTRTSNIEYQWKQSCQWLLLPMRIPLLIHTCNLSYSGGSHQEDCGSKPALSWINPSQKMAGKLAQDVGPEYKHQYHKKKSL
jgi:hypothetical protein